MMALVKKLLKVVAVGAVVTFIPGLPPYENFKVVTLAPTKRFEGALDHKNYALDKMERLFEGRIVGAESFETCPKDPNAFYTALLDGDIVKISKNGKEMTSLGVRMSKECASPNEPHKCGLPIGLRFDRDGRHLIVADSYLGLFKIDVESGKLENLVPGDELVDGKKNRIYNSLMVSKKTGKIYYTVSSTNYYFHEGVGDLLGNPSGRLMVYDPTTKKSTVLKEELAFPKGVILSPDEDFLIMGELLQYRLLRYWLKGPKAGTIEVFLDGIPGVPDNFHVTPGGNFIFPLVTVQQPDKFDSVRFAQEHPWLRKFYLRIMHLIKFPLDFAANKLDLSIAKYLTFNLLNFDFATNFIPPYALAMEVDWNGKIVNSWHGRSLDKTFFSTAYVMNGSIYFGSPIHDFIGRVPLDTSK